MDKYSGNCIGLKVSFQKISHAGIQMHRGVASPDIMIAVGVKLHFKLLICLNQLFCKLVGVLRVNIIISGAMTNQEFPL